MMVARLILDRAGRVVLPKSVRDELHLRPGDALELESSESEIVLRPVRGIRPLRKKQGVWVLGAGKAFAAEIVNQSTQKIREERDSPQPREAAVTSSRDKPDSNERRRTGPQVSATPKSIFPSSNHCYLRL